jgi:hypothetical protein
MRSTSEARRKLVHAIKLYFSRELITSYEEAAPLGSLPCLPCEYGKYIQADSSKANLPASQRRNALRLMILITITTPCHSSPAPESSQH